MTSDLYKSDSLALLIGDNSADIAFYLPNPPMMPDNIKPNESNFIEQVIELNGNHWRKILTIMAKIAVKSDNADAWRAVRNQLFMPSNELIITKLVINSAQLEQAKVHIICGQQALESIKANNKNNAELGEAIFKAKPLDEKQKIMAHKQILITPYLDYRQFSNQQISLVRSYISKLN